MGAASLKKNVKRVNDLLREHKHSLIDATGRVCELTEHRSFRRIIHVDANERRVHSGRNMLRPPQHLWRMQRHDGQSWLKILASDHIVPPVAQRAKSSIEQLHLWRT